MNFDTYLFFCSIFLAWEVYQIIEIIDPYKN